MENNSKNNSNSSSNNISKNNSDSNGSSIKMATAADKKAMVQSTLDKHTWGSSINLSAPAQDKHADATKDTSKLFKVAARNLRHHHGVQSMTPADLKRTMALLELPPRRLVVHGLAPRQLLRRTWRQDTPEPEGDDAELEATAWECVGTNSANSNDSSDSSDSHYHDGKELEQDVTERESDDGQEPCGEDCGSDSDHHDGVVGEQEGSGDKKAKHPIHAALIAGGINVRRREIKPLFHVLGVGPGRLVRLGLLDGEALRAMRAEKGWRGGHGVQGRRRGDHMLGHPASPPPRHHGPGHRGWAERGESRGEGGHGDHGPWHGGFEHGKRPDGGRGGLWHGAAHPSFGNPHGRGGHDKTHGGMNGRREGGHEHDRHHMHSDSGDECSHPHHGRDRPSGFLEHGGLFRGHPCPPWHRGGEDSPSPPPPGPGHRGGPMCGMRDDGHMHGPPRHGGRFHAHGGGPRRGVAMDVEMRHDDWHRFAGHGRRYSGHDRPMGREEGRHEYARRGPQGLPHHRCSQGPHGGGGRRGEVGGRIGVYVPGF